VFCTGKLPEREGRALAGMFCVPCVETRNFPINPCCVHRAEWKADDEPCQKLPFELWMHMKAEGSEDIMHCLQITHVGLLELTTPEV